MSAVVWSGTYTSGSQPGIDVRVIDRGSGQTPRMTVEWLSGHASMGEPIWQPYGSLNLDLLAQISIALGIIAP